MVGSVEIEMVWKVNIDMNQISRVMTSNTPLLSYILLMNNYNSFLLYTFFHGTIGGFLMYQRTVNYEWKQSVSS